MSQYPPPLSAVHAAFAVRSLGRAVLGEVLILILQSGSGVEGNVGQR